MGTTRTTGTTRLTPSRRATARGAGGATTATASGATKRPRRRARRPNLSFERELLAGGHQIVGGLDEVGRGAWAGPMYVGVVVLDATTKSVPKGTNDSKLLTAGARERLGPKLDKWCLAWSIGEVSAAEIDVMGLTASLRLAAHRALVALPVPPDALVVDGPVDFISPKDGETGSLFDAGRQLTLPEVHPVVRADAKCGSVAAASVLAKVARDTYMSSLEGTHPGYSFELHKGYGTAAHAAAIERHGLTEQHRRSWSFAIREDELVAKGSRQGKGALPLA